MLLCLESLLLGHLSTNASSKVSGLICTILELEIRGLIQLTMYHSPSNY